MKKLFTAIRRGELAQVIELLQKNCSLINCTAKQPPKKDDGQSPLQVAIKSGNFEIADYLIDVGADVNFMESEGCNEWKMPVIHDAIRAAVMSSRFLRTAIIDGQKGWEIHNTKERFDSAFSLLKKMFHAGADIDCHDSYGNSCLGRAILDAKQILPRKNYKNPEWTDERPLNEELVEDLSLVFNLLIAMGADVNEVDERTGRSLLEFNGEECVAQFLLPGIVEEL